MSGARSILVVEDDHDIRESLVEALQGRGYAVAAARDGLDALEQLRANETPPALILLDLRMPRMDGFELCEELARVEPWSAIPVVVLTAEANATAKVKPFAVADVLRKPVPFARLFEVVDKATRPQDAPARLASDAPLSGNAWFATTLASIGDAVIATDATGRVQYINAVGEQLTGWSLAEAKGRLLPEVFRILSEHSREVVEAPVAKVLREGTIVGLVNHTLLVRRDGSELNIDDSAAPIRAADGTIIGVVMVFRDVTEKRLEEARQSFLYGATRLLASSLDAEQAVTTVAQLVVPHVADWCAIDLVDDDGQVRRLAVVHSDPKKVELAQELRRRHPPDPEASGGVAEVLRTGVAALVPEIDEETLARAIRNSEHMAIARQLGLHSYMVVPIRGPGRVLGTVSLVNAEAKRAFTPQDLRLAEQLCDSTAIALTNARLFREAEQAKAQAERASARIARLQEVTLALAGTTTQDEVANVAMDYAFSHLRATASVLYVQSGGAFRLAAYRGLPPSIGRWNMLPLDAPLPLARALATGAPQWLESREALLEAYPQLAQSETPEEKLQSIIALPLLLRGSVAGGLALSFAEPREVPEHEREMHLSMAGQIAQSLERTGLREAEEAAQARLAENEARYRYIFESAAVGIAEKDYTAVKQKLDAVMAGGVRDVRSYLHAHPEFVEEAIDLVRVRDVNPAMMRLLGATEKSQLASLRSIFLPESCDLLIEELVALMDGTRIVSGETLLRRLDGGRIHALTTVAFPPSGCDRVLISRTDITEHRKLLEERQHLVDKLTDTVRFNEMFTAILGHDLRNPLGAIVMATELLKMEAPDEDAVRPVQRIRNSADRMARMIEQMLDFTRARLGGGIVIEPSAVDARALAAQLVDELEGAARQQVVLRATGDAQGVWDGDRLAQVISNLLGNAIEHGAVSQPIRVEIDGTMPEVVRIEVGNGGAIPEELLPRLFDPFRRASGERKAEKSKGLGLGLYIVQQLVQAHGGTIDVLSNPHEGTRFVVTLPRRTGSGGP